MSVGNSKKTILGNDTDTEIMMSLYKSSFLTEKQLSILIGENCDYVKGRCKELSKAGLVKRKVVRKIAVNYLTAAGIKVLNLPIRNTNEPKLSRYEHTLGCMDVCTWLAMPHKFKDGSTHSIVPFGSIITERDFFAVREMQVVRHRADGQPVYVALDRNIHAPDGYFRRSDGTFTAIEFERTQKSQNAILRNNICENMKRFRHQYWVYEDPYVGKILQQIRSELGETNITVFDIHRIRHEMDMYIANIPKVISSKTGVPRRSCLGQMAEPLPLNKLPILPQYQQTVSLETRPKVPAAKSLPTSNIQPATQPGSTVSNSFITPAEVTSKTTTQPVTPSLQKSLFLERR